MKNSIWLLIAVAGVAVCAASARADSMWDYQAVNSAGYGIHPKVWADETDPASRIIIEGVALAGVDEILDPGLQYTVFLQDDMSDRGGMQAWTGKFLYGDALWAYFRSTDYIDFSAGDRLRITGLIADMGRGKVVINNRGHSGAPNLVWHVDILGHPGLPDPQLIASVSHCNYFDETRAGGGERYQGRYVMLHGVEVTAGSWGNNSLMTIGDATGSVGMLLSAVGDFGVNPQPQGRLNVVGIFDQEDDQVSPYTGGYRVWVKKAADISAALDACREAGARDAGERVALAGKVVSRVFDGFFFIQDEGRAGGVRVNSSHAVAPGDIVSVAGVIVEEDGGKAISASYVSRSAGGAAPRPLFVNSGVVRGESGLNVQGLLVRAAGVAGASDGEGGFSLTDAAGTVAARVSGGAAPQQGAAVIVTGVAVGSGDGAALVAAGPEDIEMVTQ